MPTLFRLVVVLGLVTALVYGAMLALVSFVHPEQREITETVTLPNQDK